MESVSRFHYNRGTVYDITPECSVHFDFEINYFGMFFNKQNYFVSRWSDVSKHCTITLSCNMSSANNSINVTYRKRDVNTTFDGIRRHSISVPHWLAKAAKSSQDRRVLVQLSRGSNRVIGRVVSNGKISFVCERHYVKNKRHEQILGELFVCEWDSVESGSKYRPSFGVWSAARQISTQRMVMMKARF